MIMAKLVYRFSVVIFILPFNNTLNIVNKFPLSRIYFLIYIAPAVTFQCDFKPHKQVGNNKPNQDPRMKKTEV